MKTPFGRHTFARSLLAFSLVALLLFELRCVRKQVTLYESLLFSPVRGHTLFGLWDVRVGHVLRLETPSMIVFVQWPNLVLQQISGSLTGMTCAFVGTSLDTSIVFFEGVKYSSEPCQGCRWDVSTSQDMSQNEFWVGHKAWSVPCQPDMLQQRRFKDNKKLLRKLRSFFFFHQTLLTNKERFQNK